MKWEDIPQFTRNGSYEVNVPLDLLENFLNSCFEQGLELNPDFQRGHVWTKDQQTNYMEYFFKGGQSGKVLYFNQPSWQTKNTTKYNDFVCVDGLQRLTAIRLFNDNKIKAFGQFKDEFSGRIRMAPHSDSLRVNINNLQTKKAVLTWYLQMNSGGTPHTESEIDKVKLMLSGEL